MALRKIVERGDPVLEKVCRPVTDFNRRLHVLLDDMAETLEESGGIGLAAPETALQSHIQQPLTEGCQKPRNQIIQITVQIKHRYCTP